MSYEHLPIEERIKLAADYALLLTNDEHPHPDIIGELQITFQLSEEEAKAAYVRMRAQRRTEFKKVIGSQIGRVVIVNIVSFVCTIIMMAFAPAAGVFYFIMAGIFALGFSGSLMAIARLLREKNRTAQDGLFRERAREKELEKESEGDWTRQLPFIFVLMGIMAWAMFSNKGRSVDVNELITPNVVTINEVSKSSSGGNNPDFYFNFLFEGNSNTFRLQNSLYDYGFRPVKLNDFKKGDTISIQIRNEDIEKARNTNGTQIIKLYNITVGNKWLIDLYERNLLVNKENKNSFIFMLLAFFAANLLGFLWIRFR